MDRIVDIFEDGRHLRRDRGFLVVEASGEELGRVALDEVQALIVHAHGITYSNSLLAHLGEIGVVVVLCAPNHFPRSVLLPLDGHHMQGARANAQWQSKKPLHKQLWKQIVAAKIQMQIAHMKARMQNTKRLERMLASLRSGDPDNIEAQAARFYWPSLFGENFRRDRASEGANALLNYGYTILRASVARGLVASGLNPSIGIHHANQYNAFALVDDMMEPLRPIVDAAVFGLSGSGVEEVNKDAKLALARLIALDLQTPSGRSPISTVINRLCYSLARSFETGKANLELPTPPTAMEFLAMGRIDEPA